MTSTVDTLTAPSAVSTDAGLPEQVSAHMQDNFPEDVDAGGWICARDFRDNTAVVVWRPCRDNHELLPGGARAILIYRWHVSLQAAGFISVPRTDMEVFGRPDEQAPDGRARWLHITGWDAGLVVEPRGLHELVRDLTHKVSPSLLRHSVQLDPVRTPVTDTVYKRAVRPDLIDLVYRADGGVAAVVYEGDTGHPLGARLPGWVRELADKHRWHAWDVPRCELHDLTEAVS